MDRARERERRQRARKTRKRARECAPAERVWCGTSSAMCTLALVVLTRTLWTTHRTGYSGSREVEPARRAVPTVLDTTGCHSSIRRFSHRRHWNSAWDLFQPTTRSVDSMSWGFCTPSVATPVVRAQTDLYDALCRVYYTQVNWRAGQRVVVTTTHAKDSRDFHQNEIRIIKSVADGADGETAKITLDKPLKFKHHASPE